MSDDFIEMINDINGFIYECADLFFVWIYL